MASSFLLAFREGIEAALIVSILLGTLVKFGKKELIGKVWLGVFAAIIGCVIAGAALTLLGIQMSEEFEPIYEGVLLAVSAGLLTWVILWISNSGKTLKAQITKTAQNNNIGTGVFSLAFFAIFREGLELALFLAALNANTELTATLGGTLAGLILAVLIGWLLYRGTIQFDLRKFFSITNSLLVLMAAGMAAMSIHEFAEAGLFPWFTSTAWDISWLVSKQSTTGLLLKAMFGFNPAPSAAEVAVYLVYLTVVGGILVSRFSNIASSQQEPASA